MFARSQKYTSRRALACESRVVSKTGSSPSSRSFMTPDGWYQKMGYFASRHSSSLFVGGGLRVRIAL